MNDISHENKEKSMDEWRSARERIRDNALFLAQELGLDDEGTKKVVDLANSALRLGFISEDPDRSYAVAETVERIDLEWLKHLTKQGEDNE